MFIISKSQAVSLGFTHHASYFGVPLWMKFVGKGQEIVICCKVPLTSHLLHGIMWLSDCMAWLMFHPQQTYNFKKGKEIK